MILRFQSVLNANIKSIRFALNTNGNNTIRHYAMFDPFKQKQNVDDKRKDQQNTQPQLLTSNEYKFRNRYDIPESYQLIYKIKYEPIVIGSIIILRSTSSISAAVGFSLICCELMQFSKFSTTFEDFYFNAGILSSYMVLLYGMSYIVQAITVMRIYRKPTENKYMLVKMKSAFGLESVKFETKDILYRPMGAPLLKWKILEALSKFYGKFFIKGKIRDLSLENFTSDKELYDMVGPKIASFIENERRKTY